MSHYYSEKPTVGSNPKNKKVIIGGVDFLFETDNGVFSKRGLDFGTRTLLESIEFKKNDGSVLDFGCGYGPIGIFIKKTTNLNVDMLDINERSIKLSKNNANLNKVKVNVFKSNFYDNVEMNYDYIVSNPPIRIGKEALYELLKNSLKHLKPTGELWIVVHKDQGAKSTAKYLETMASVEIVNKNKGFFVIKAQLR